MEIFNKDCRNTAPKNLVDIQKKRESCNRYVDYGASCNRSTDHVLKVLLIQELEYESFLF